MEDRLTDYGNLKINSCSKDHERKRRQSLGGGGGGGGGGSGSEDMFLRTFLNYRVYKNHFLGVDASKSNGSETDQKLDLVLEP